MASLTQGFFWWQLISIQFVGLRNREGKGGHCRGQIGGDHIAGIGEVPTEVFGTGYILDTSKR